LIISGLVVVVVCCGWFGGVFWLVLAYCGFFWLTVRDVLCILLFVVPVRGADQNPEGGQTMSENEQNDRIRENIANDLQAVLDDPDSTFDDFQDLFEDRDPLEFL
jgi:hypothetical protein